MVTRGFKSRRQRTDPSRVPPGQYVTDDFPVLSAGPTQTHGYHLRGDPWKEERYAGD